MAVVKLRDITYFPTFNNQVKWLQDNNVLLLLEDWENETIKWKIMVDKDISKIIPHNIQQYLDSHEFDIIVNLIVYQISNGCGHKVGTVEEVLEWTKS